MVPNASSLKSQSSKMKNPNASLQSLHPKASYRLNFDNTAAPVLFPSIMQRRHPECSADSCTLSASIARSSHQTCSPGRLPHCNFAAILSAMWHLAVDTELRKQTHSAESLESSTQTKNNSKWQFQLYFHLTPVSLIKPATRRNISDIKLNL